MPLTPGKSRKVISENIHEMDQAGHPHKQSVAAALHNADKKGHSMKKHPIDKSLKEESYYSDSAPEHIKAALLKAKEAHMNDRAPSRYPKEVGHEEMHPGNEEKFVGEDRKDGSGEHDDKEESFGMKKPKMGGQSKSTGPHKDSMKGDKETRAYPLKDGETEHMKSGYKGHHMSILKKKSEKAPMKEEEERPRPSPYYGKR